MRFATFLLCLKQAACLIYSIKLAEGEDFDKLQVESAEGTHQLDPSIIQFFTEIAENPGADGYALENAKKPIQEANTTDPTDATDATGLPLEEEIILEKEPNQGETFTSDKLMAIATGLAEPYCYNRDLIKRRTIENENAPIVLESATGNVQVGEIKFMSLNVLGYMYTTLLHDTFYLRGADKFLSPSQLVKHIKRRTMFHVLHSGRITPNLPVSLYNGHKSFQIFGSLPHVYAQLMVQDIDVPNFLSSDIFWSGDGSALLLSKNDLANELKLARILEDAKVNPIPLITQSRTMFESNNDESFSLVQKEGPLIDIVFGVGLNLESSVTEEDLERMRVHLDEFFFVEYLKVLYSAVDAGLIDGDLYMYMLTPVHSPAFSISLRGLHRALKYGSKMYPLPDVKIIVPFSNEMNVTDDHVRKSFEKLVDNLNENGVFGVYPLKIQDPTSEALEEAFKIIDE